MSTITSLFSSPIRVVALPAALVIMACSRGDDRASRGPGVAPGTDTSGTLLRVTETTLAGSFGAAGIAAPIEEATVSTTLMGTVTEVLVHEGDRVHIGQALLRIDTRELTARGHRLSASLADAEAIHGDAQVQARRFEALYADSAATRAQYDAAQTGLARAEAGVRAARAAVAELDAVSNYAVLRAPFDGTVTNRAIDRGGLAAPGSPLLTIQNATSLRVSATAPIDVTRGLRRGQSISVTLSGSRATATIEGVVPAGSSDLFTVNAVIRNSGNRYVAGSSATIHIPTDSTRGILIPTRAIERDGDLLAVLTDRDGLRERRWIRVGEQHGDQIEVTSGLREGDRIVLPVAPPSTQTASPSSGEPGSVQQDQRGGV